MSEQIATVQHEEPRGDEETSTDPQRSGLTSRTRSALVVDASPAVRLATQRMLKREGFAEQDIHLAASGKECLEAYREHDPQMVFLSIDLPHAGGHEVAERILQEDPMARIVVTTVGPSRDDERVRQAVAHGAFDVLEKPIRRREIADLMRLVTDEAIGVDRIE